MDSSAEPQARRRRERDAARDTSGGTVRSDTYRDAAEAAADSAVAASLAQLHDASGYATHGAPQPKRPRLHWNEELHTRFLRAVEFLGVDTAVPKAILGLMNVEGLTRENVASHLQKHRLALQRQAPISAAEQASAAPSDAPAPPGAPGASETSSFAPAAAAAAPPAAAQAAGEAGKTSAAAAPPFSSSDEARALLASPDYAALFAPGAGTRMPSGTRLESFILGRSELGAQRGADSPPAHPPDAAAREPTPPDAAACEAPPPAE